MTVASLAVAVNTGAAAVGDLPAGPYLRVELLGAGIALAGQSLTADLALERVSTAGGTSVVRAAVTNLALVLTSGGQPMVSLTQGSGALLLTSTGLAGDIGGTLVVSIPGIALSGALRLAVNSTDGEVNEVIPVGGTDVLLALPANPVGSPYLRFVGAGVSIEVLGQTLSGDVTLERTGTTTHLLVTGAELALGGGLVTVTDASADLTSTPGGAYGSFSGTVALGIPGVTITGTLGVELDTRPATRRLAVTGTDVLLGVAGQTLRGDVAFEQATLPSGATVVKIAIANTAGHPLLELTTDGTPLLTVSSGSGQFLVTSAGIAGSLTAQVTLALPGGLGLSAEQFRVNVSTMAAPVTETFLLDGTSSVLTLPAGPYLSVRAIGATLTLPASGPSLSGSFAFEQRTPADGTDVTVVAAADVVVDVTIDSQGAKLTEGEGAFVLLPGGLAGYISGTADIAAGPVSAGANILLRINTTSGPIDEASRSPVAPSR